MMSLSRRGGTSLRQLLQGFAATSTVPDVLLGGISLDSRRIQPGWLFIALSGATTDGRAFIPQAIERGAAAVLVDKSSQTTPVQRKTVPIVEVEQLSEFVSDIAGAFFGHPSHQMRVTGVTGTNGKTTCSQLLARLQDRLGQKSAYIGTLGYGFAGRGEKLTDTGLTTPDAVSVQAVLAELYAEGAKNVVMEASSHALVQRRIAGLRIDTAIFTNLSHDHLDYHADFNSYAAAKARLFAMNGLHTAVLNFDDPVGQLIGANLRDDIRRIDYSTQQKADVYCTDAMADADGLRARVVTPWGDGELQSPLLGQFNLSNLLAILTAACAQGFALADVLREIPHLGSVAGRMELVGPEAQPHVVVDYAHTPDALAKVLQALRVHCKGELWCLFGCGGDRDRTKRPLMGEVAEQAADRVVVTSDNPRSESPQQIIDDILNGITSRERVQVRIDRRDAIEFAIANAAENDIVLIAGKGHEDYQLVGAQRLPFSDQAEARLALRRRAGGAR